MKFKTIPFRHSLIFEGDKQIMGWKRKLWYPRNDIVKGSTVWENWETGWHILQGEECWMVLDQDGWLQVFTDTLEKAVHYAQDEAVWEAYCKEREERKKEKNNGCEIL